MATRQNESDRGKTFLDQPSMDPAKQDKFRKADDAGNPEPAAEFPAEAANDLGQILSEQSIAHPFSAQLSDEGGLQGENAAQNGGAGPRIDDLGVNDLTDKNDLNKDDLPAMDQLARKETPVFDKSIDNRDPDRSNKGAADNSKRPEAGLDELSDEDLRPYDISLDGPGTADLH